jgi:hypothetical protein
MNNFVGLTKPFVNPFLYEWWPKMGNLRKIKFVFVLLIIISLIQIGTINSKALTEAARCKKCELSLKEAITVGSKRAKEWDKDASLSRIGSVDENMGGSRGENGKRYNWFLNFIVPGTEKELIVGVSTGEISTVRQVRASSNEVPIKLEDIKFDSPYLLEIAKKRYGLQKSLDWATGYHFILSLLNGKPTITVLGMDKNYLFTRINFDPSNGTITGAIHKVPSGGGLRTINLGSNAVKTSKNDMAIIGVSANGNSLVTWGDKNPRVFNFAVQPFVEISKNLGETWSLLNFHQNVTDAWLTYPNELYLSTDSEIWRIETSDNKMKNLFKSKSSIEKVDHSTNNNMAVLSGKYIYKTSDNGKHWSKVIKPIPDNDSIIQLQISDRGQLFLLTKNKREILTSNDGRWNPLRTPKNFGTASYMKLIGNNLLLLTNNSLWVNNLENNQWSKVTINDFITSIINKGNNLFAISGDGTIYLIKLSGVNGWIGEKLFQLRKGIVTDLEITQNDLFIATVPDYFWENINLSDLKVE